jgi:hypothetical protein
LNVTNNMRIRYFPSAAPIHDVAAVDSACPGLSTAIRALHSAVRASFEANPRVPLNSDFIDAVHAMYAPYVSLFRADRFMSPHIEKQVSHRGVEVVSRLEDLPGRIRELLGSSKHLES